MRHALYLLALTAALSAFGSGRASAQAGGPPPAWTASDCACLPRHDRQCELSTQRARKERAELRDLSRQRAGALPRQVGWRDWRPVAIAQDAPGPRCQRQVPDVPREGRTGELARRHA